MGLLSSKLGCPLAFCLEEADPAKSWSEPHILYFGGVLIYSCIQCGFSLCTFSLERECSNDLLNQWKDLEASQYCHKKFFCASFPASSPQPQYNSSVCCGKLHLVCAAHPMALWFHLIHLGTHSTCKGNCPLKKGQRKQGNKTLAGWRPVVLWCY